MLIRDKAFADEDESIREEMEVEWYLQRLERGLYTLQMSDYILAWLSMEDDAVCSLLISSSSHFESDDR